MPTLLDNNTKNLPKYFNGEPLEATTFPAYAIKEDNPKDQFFTKEDVASHCVNIFWEVSREHNYNLDNHTFIEPAAGEGVFYRLLPENRRIGLDIDPQNPKIRKTDFLSWTPPEGCILF